MAQIMASNREERRLQRLRGAQAHRVGDLDFGIQVSTARPVLPQIPSTRRTPAARGRGRPSSSKSTRSQRDTSPATSDLSPSDANISIKRRRIDVSELDEPSFSSRSTRSMRKRTDIYDIQDDGTEVEPIQEEEVLEEDDELVGDESSLMQVQLLKSVKRGKSRSHIVDEVAESPHDAPGSGQRKQRALGQAQALGSILQQAIDVALPHSPRRQRSQSGDALQSNPNYEVPGLRSPKLGNAADMDELSPDMPTKNFPLDSFSDVEAEIEHGAEAIDDVEAATHLRRKQKRKSAVMDENGEITEREPQAQSQEREVLKKSNDSSKRGKRRSKASPASQRQRKASKSGVGSISSNPSQDLQRKRKEPKVLKADVTRNKKSRATIPITVHRLTKPISFGDEDEDILAADIPYSKRSGVNAVDVLAQVCEEFLDSAINTLEQGGRNAEESKIRREYVTKLRAVESFQEELRVFLFDLTTLLDANHAVTKRVRDAQKEKIQLRQDLLRIRSQREQIALQVDAVRMKHEAHNQEAQEQNALNNDITDIELAISLGMDQFPDDTGPTPPDLGSLLESIGSELSNKSETGGILKQMKEFNGFLERAALALEGRTL